MILEPLAEADGAAGLATGFTGALTDAWAAAGPATTVPAMTAIAATAYAFTIMISPEGP
jgi:hypothetical protein